MANLRGQGKSRTRNVPFATTATARIRMLLSFAMGVIWLFTRNVTVCHSYRKDNGSAAAASGWGVGPLPQSIL